MPGVRGIPGRTTVMISQCRWKDLWSYRILLESFDVCDLKLRHMEYLCTTSSMAAHYQISLHKCGKVSKGRSSSRFSNLVSLTVIPAGLVFISISFILDMTLYYDFFSVCFSSLSSFSRQRFSHVPLRLLPVACSVPGI